MGRLAIFFRGRVLVSIGPTVRRRRLGSELRSLREGLSIKLEEVADQLGIAPSTLSRIETGKAPTRNIYLTHMLEIYGVRDVGQRQILVDMAREGHRKGWWASFDDVLPAGFGIYVGLEAEAASLRVYEPQVVHGLLQTRAYAREVMRTVRRHESPAEIDQRVELRIRRQDVLTRADPLELWIILDEAVIRRDMGPRAVRYDQLCRLCDATLLPNVTLQVLSFDSGLHPALNGSFAILEFPERFDPDVIYSEGISGQGFIEEGDRAVRTGTETFELLRATALPPVASAKLIRDIRRKC